jgi:hypothetical protein
LVPDLQRGHHQVDHAEPIGHGPRADPTLVLYMGTLWKGLNTASGCRETPWSRYFDDDQQPYAGIYTGWRARIPTQDAGWMGCADVRTGGADRFRTRNDIPSRSQHHSDNRNPHFPINVPELLPPFPLVGASPLVPCTGTTSERAPAHGIKPVCETRGLPRRISGETTC